MIAAGLLQPFRAGRTAEPFRKRKRAVSCATGRVGRICRMFGCGCACAGVRDAKYTKMLPTLPTLPGVKRNIDNTDTYSAHKGGRVGSRSFRRPSGTRFSADVRQWEQTVTDSFADCLCFWWSMRAVIGGLAANRGADPLSPALEPSVCLLTVCSAKPQKSAIYRQYRQYRQLSKNFPMWARMYARYATNRLSVCSI